MVTSDAGYIGSHTCDGLLKAGHSVIIADNPSNSCSFRTGKQLNAKILLVNPTNFINETKVYIENKYPNVYLLGGQAAIPDSMLISLGVKPGK